MGGLRRWKDSERALALKMERISPGVARMIDAAIDYCATTVRLSKAILRRQVAI